MASRIVQRLALTFVLQIALGGCVLAQSTAMAPPPTFSKDVAPILQKNCQTCHRPGEGGPFSLLTYDDARPMAFSIKRVVSQKIMPPWFADPKFGHFSNERSLSEKEIATLVAWANAGAPEGDQERPAATDQFGGGLGNSQARCDFPAAASRSRFPRPARSSIST